MFNISPAPAALAAHFRGPAEINILCVYDVPVMIEKRLFDLANAIQSDLSPLRSIRPIALNLLPSGDR
jgi:hypothetical protein